MPMRKEPAYGQWYIAVTTAGHATDRTNYELQFVLPRLAVTRGQSILDVGCNRGRHSIALAAEGYVVTGIDPESEAIAFAKDAASEAGVSVSFVCGDIAEDMAEAGQPLSGFDAAICLGTSLGFHATDEGDQRQLNAIYRALAPGGRFVLETTTLLTQDYGDGVRRTWARAGEMLVVDEGRFDALTCRAHHVTDYLQGDVMRRREEHYRVYAAPEMMKMLRVAGFEIVDTYGSYSGDPFTLTSGCFIAVCRKLV